MPASGWLLTILAESSTGATELALSADGEPVVGEAWHGRRVPSEILHLEFDGRRLASRMSGHGPALVMFNLYRRRPDLMHRWRVFQSAPLGYGYSDRVPGSAGEWLADQILAVL